MHSMKKADGDGCLKLIGLIERVKSNFRIWSDE